MLDLLTQLTTRTRFEAMSAKDQRRIFGHAIFGRTPFLFDKRTHTWVVGPTAGFGGNRNVQDIPATEFHAAIAERRTVKFSR